MQPMDSIH